MININTAIKKGTNILNKNGIKCSQLDSEILLAEALYKDRKYILLNQDSILECSN